MGWPEVRAVRLNLCRTAGLRSTHRLVLYAIADAVDTGMKAWPSLATLCEWTWLGKTALCVALSELEEAGLISRVNRLPGGGMRSTLYKYTGPTLSADRETDSARGGQCDNRTDTVREADSQLYARRTDTVREADTKEPMKGPLKRTNEKTTAECREILSFWAESMGKGTRGADHKSAIGKKRIGLIRARLKDGLTTDDLKLAIKNCSASAWHMGANDRGTPYNDLTLILRPEKVEAFMERVEPVAQPAPGKPGVYDPFRLEKPWEREQRLAGHSKPWTPDPDAPLVSMAEYMGYDSDGKEDK